MAPTLMIVDDSKVARLVARGVLQRLRPDWSPLEAANAEEARALLRERGVDILLLDVNMPGIRGIDFARELRAERPAMPIAIVSADVQDETAAAARALDLAFIPKPLTEEALTPFLAAAALRLRRAGAA